MEILKSRTEERDGFTLTIQRILDDDPDLSYLTQEYEDESPSNRAKYRAQDAARLKAYRHGNWYMVGVMVTVRKQTKTNWADGGLEVGRASVWGIESDSDESYFAEVERDMIAEALHEVDNLREALCGKR